MDNASRIADYIAICDVKAQYCRLIDSKDWPAFTELFTEDFEIEVKGRAPLGGRAPTMELIASYLGGATTVHQVHTPEMQIDGDVALVVWPFQDRIVYPEGDERGPRNHTGFGRYHERYERADGKWRIAAQRPEYLLTEDTASK